MTRRTIVVAIAIVGSLLIFWSLRGKNQSNNSEAVANEMVQQAPDRVAQTKIPVWKRMQSNEALIVKYRLRSIERRPNEPDKVYEGRIRNLNQLEEFFSQAQLSSEQETEFLNLATKAGKVFEFHSENYTTPEYGLPIRVEKKFRYDLRKILEPNQLENYKKFGLTVYSMVKLGPIG